MMSIISTLIGPVGEVAKWVGSEISSWREREAARAAARLEAEIAEIKARAELAAYRVKSEVEWDMQWAQAADRSWKDEFLLLLWAAPTIGVFVPGLRPYVEDGFEFLSRFSPDAPTMFMTGWAIIFAATFGIRQAMHLMVPRQKRLLLEAMSQVPDDMPESAVYRASEALKAKK